MRFSNKHYSGILLGHKVSMALLKGRDYRPDSHHIFSDPEDGETVWYKTLPVGLDKSCQEAYLVFGILIAEDNTVADVGAGVMYMDSGTGNCMCSWASDSDSEDDVDNSDDFQAEQEEEDDDDDDDNDEDENDDDDGDEETGEEDDNEDDKDDDDDTHPKHIMDVLPLDWMLAEKTPFTLEHEAAMILKGRWLPESFMQDDQVQPLPVYLANRFLGGAGQDSESEYPILDEITFTITEGSEENYWGSFDILANRGTRYFVCNFSGSLEDGSWTIQDIGVDSYASTGSGWGNVFNRPHTLDENEHDYRQACLLLCDFYCDAEFAKLI